MLICVAHKEPQCPPIYDICIGMGTYHGDVSVRELDPFWADMRAVSWGAAGLLVIPKLLARYSDPVVGICSQHKIIYQEAIGTVLAKSGGQQYGAQVREVLPQLARPREGMEFLIGKELRLAELAYLNPRNIEGHYKIAHVPVDLANYLQIAAEHGVIPSPRAVLETQVIMTGACTLGYYPRAWLLDKMTQLEKVGRIFVERYAYQLHERDGYQVRALEFCMERIGSYFLDQLRLSPNAFGVQLYFDLDYATGDKGGSNVNW